MRVHFDVVGRLDNASSVQRGRLTIDRSARLVMVRPHRRRRVYVISLDVVADLVVRAVVVAELRERHAERERNKRRRKKR